MLGPKYSQYEILLPCLKRKSHWLSCSDLPYIKTCNGDAIAFFFFLPSVLSVCFYDSKACRNSLALHGITRQTLRSEVTDINVISQEMQQIISGHHSQYKQFIACLKQEERKKGRKRGKGSGERK